MISEVANSLFLTYAISEIVLISEVDSLALLKRWLSSKQMHHIRAGAVVVALVNLLDRMTGAAEIIDSAFSIFLHIPRIAFAALVYLVGLYMDCRRVEPNLHFTRAYLPEVGRAFLYVLPVYPLLAVLISALFLAVITVCDALRLPEGWLNAPIYYGTLYGPLSAVYWRVKRAGSDKSGFLPVLLIQDR